MEENTITISAVVYLVICLLVSNIGANRGHHMGAAFMTCLFCTPLIGAILFSHYKPKE